MTKTNKNTATTATTATTAATEAVKITLPRGAVGAVKLNGVEVATIRKSDSGEDHCYGWFGAKTGPLAGVESPAWYGDPAEAKGSVEKAIREAVQPKAAPPAKAKRGRKAAAPAEAPVAPVAAAPVAAAPVAAAPVVPAKPKLIKTLERLSADERTAAGAELGVEWPKGATRTKQVHRIATAMLDGGKVPSSVLPYLATSAKRSVARASSFDGGHRKGWKRYNVVFDLLAERGTMTVGEVYKALHKEGLDTEGNRGEKLSKEKFADKVAEIVGRMPECSFEGDRRDPATVLTFQKR